MATLIKGLLAASLDWEYVLVGVVLSVTIELVGVRSLAFAVGAYLPLSTRTSAGTPAQLGNSTPSWRADTTVSSPNHSSTKRYRRVRGLQHPHGSRTPARTRIKSSLMLSDEDVTAPCACSGADDGHSG